MTRILAIVFDMDELIGQFVEAGMFWDGLQHYFKNKLTDTDFFHMMDLFPQFLRPNIISIFNYLKHQKQSRNNIRVYIFTNFSVFSLYKSSLSVLINLGIFLDNFYYIVSFFSYFQVYYDRSLPLLFFQVTYFLFYLFP